MTTRMLTTNPHRPDGAVIEEAARVIGDGGLVAFPTETVYGLGADALNPTAVQAIFAAKGRPADNPLIVHVADVEQLHELVTDIPPVVDTSRGIFGPVRSH